MSDSQNDFLRPPQVAALWGLSERQARNITAQVEALGFRLAPDSSGARLVPPGLAAAVRACRSGKRELSSLRLDPSLARYLTRGAASEELDTFELLLFVATEVSIIREVCAVATNALSVGAAATSYRRFSFANAGLPDPRSSL
jgi:hypothetical protein